MNVSPSREALVTIEDDELELVQGGYVFFAIGANVTPSSCSQVGGTYIDVPLFDVGICYGSR